MNRKDLQLPNALLVCSSNPLGCPLGAQSRYLIVRPRTATIKGGFKSCGLYPLDENAVNYTKCIQEKKKQQDAASSHTERDESDQHHFKHCHYVKIKIDLNVLRRFKKKEPPMKCGTLTTGMLLFMICG